MHHQKNRPFELADVQMHTRRLTDDVYAVMASDVDDTDHTATTPVSPWVIRECWWSNR
ncbi:hypothetical protein [Streptomyces sp. NRRL F-5122]|uniref:hypothetical protein n=1 Tax=Streptomyces sp. NRRL F-5122 TaxID=1609098 RepID=UPI000AC3F2A1|nr:hypothetical protein [Streptomyces sp. NRRL F-5122]